MKIRVLRKIAEELKSPSQLEIDTAKLTQNSYKISKRSFWISILFSCIATALVIWQIIVSPDRNQMSNLITKTDSLITKQSRLLDLSQIQIDSLVSLNMQMQKQVSIAKDQFDIANTQNEENKKVSIALSLNELSHLQIFSLRLSTYLSRFRESKRANDYSYFSVLKHRADFIQDIYDVMEAELQNKELFKNRHVGTTWRLAYANLLVEKAISEKYMLAGITIDNDLGHFITTMNRVQDLINAASDHSIKWIIELERRNGRTVDTSHVYLK